MKIKADLKVLKKYKNEGKDIPIYEDYDSLLMDENYNFFECKITSIEDDKIEPGEEKQVEIEISTNESLNLDEESSFSLKENGNITCIGFVKEIIK